VVSDRGVEGDHGGWVVVGWVLAEALVWPMVVEMTHVLVEDGEGVSLVVNHSRSVHSSRTLRTNRSA
jgi:hypothetical protein